MRTFGQMFRKREPIPFGSAVLGAIVLWIDFAGWVTLLLTFGAGFLIGWLSGVMQ